MIGYKPYLTKFRPCASSSLDSRRSHLFFQVSYLVSEFVVSGNMYSVYIILLPLLAHAYLVKAPLHPRPRLPRLSLL